MFRSNVKRFYHVMFYGNDDFSIPTLKLLMDKWLEVTSVVSDKKPNAVTQFARNHRIELHRWPPTRLDFSHGFNLGIVCSFGQRIPVDIIKCYRMGVINVHSSLLPKYRGAAPVIHAIANGDRIFGCSIMEICSERFDVGYVWAQKAIECDPSLKLPEINRLLAALGARLMHECLLDFEFYRDNCREQYPAFITHAPKINSRMSQIDWNVMCSDRIRDLDRALTGVYGLTTKWNRFSIKLYDCRLEAAETVADTGNGYTAGTFFINRKSNRIFVFCCDRKFISFAKISVNSKQIISANDFSNGYLNKTSDSLFRFDCV